MPPPRGTGCCWILRGEGLSAHLAFELIKHGLGLARRELAMGRQTEPLEFPAVEARMRAVREKASTATLKPDKPLLATIKQLLNAL